MKSQKITKPGRHCFLTTICSALLFVCTTIAPSSWAIAGDPLLSAATSLAAAADYDIADYMGLLNNTIWMTYQAQFGSAEDPVPVMRELVTTQNAKIFTEYRKDTPQAPWTAEIAEVYDLDQIHIKLKAFVNYYHNYALVAIPPASAPRLLELGAPSVVTGNLVDVSALQAHPLVAVQLVLNAGFDWVTEVGTFNNCIAFLQYSVMTGIETAMELQILAPGIGMIEKWGQTLASTDDPLTDKADLRHYWLTAYGTTDPPN